MKNIKKIIIVKYLLFFGVGQLHAQSIESVIFSAAASDNNNFQPVVGTPYGASFSGANGSLEISAAYGEGTYQQSTLSSDKIDATNEIKVWPNPTDFLVNIDLSKLPVGEYQLELLDISAKQIMAKNTKDAIAQIDLGLLPVGTYILRVSGNKDIANFKIVKRQ
jgi:hypothetical protein